MIKDILYEIPEYFLGNSYILKHKAILGTETVTIENDINLELEKDYRLSHQILTIRRDLKPREIMITYSYKDENED